MFFSGFGEGLKKRGKLVSNSGLGFSTFFRVHIYIIFMYIYIYVCMYVNVHMLLDYIALYYIITHYIIT